MCKGVKDDVFGVRKYILFYYLISNVSVLHLHKFKKTKMINSLILGLVVCAFLVIAQNVILKIYKYFPEQGVGLVYGSLGVKLIFVCGITLSLRGEIENQTLYAITILMGVLYTNVKTVIELHLKSEDKKKETT